MTLSEAVAFFAAKAAEVRPAMELAAEKCGRLVEEKAKSYPGVGAPGWAALAESTIDDKARKGLASPSPLLRNGTLKNSIQHKVEGLSVHIGSDLQIAAWQENGTSKMPPRPFLSTGLIESEAAIKTELERTLLSLLTP